MGDPVELDPDGLERLIIRMAVVGGHGGFIGNHHDAGMEYASRQSIMFDKGAPIVFETVASALHKNPALAIEGGKRRGIKRVYGSYEQLIEEEAKLPDDERAVAVSIRLPNVEQHKAVMTFLDAGYHVVVDKPNATCPSEAVAQWDKANEKGLLGFITYTYTGSPMMREMRHRIAQDGVDQLTGVHGMYPQGWILGLGKDANFRLQFATTGGFGVSADLGATHTLTDLEYVTQLDIEKITANLRTIANHEDPAKCSEIDNYGQALLELGKTLQDGKKINILGTARWSQVAGTYGNDHSLQVDGKKNSYLWVNSIIPGPGPEALGILGEDGAYHFIPRNPHKPGLLKSAEALRACKGPVAHGEGLDLWFGAIYRDAGAQIAGAVYGILVPQEAMIVRTLEHGGRTLFYLFKLAESHARGGVPVNATFNREEIPALEKYVRDNYLAKIAPK